MPLTRAITASEGEAASGWAGWDDEFFEQPPAAGRISSASAATIANFVPRGRAVNIGLAQKGEFGEVMARSSSDAAAAGGGRVGQSRNRSPFAMAEIMAILTIT